MRSSHRAVSASPCARPATQPTLLSSLRRALATIDPELQLFDVFSMPERVEKSLNPRKSPMMLALGFGAVAFLLSLATTMPWPQ
jgi:hypothetical protein